MGRQLSDQVSGTETTKDAGLRRVLGRYVLLGGLGAMALLPALALDKDRPAALGWQMYAGVVELPSINVVLSDGSQEERPIGSIASGFRPELDYFKPVAHFVCSRDRDAVAVRLKSPRPSREEEFLCGTF